MPKEIAVRCWWCTAAILFLWISFAQAAEPAYHVADMREERYRDTDFAVVVPQRLEMVCRTAPENQWGFAFAGMEVHSRAALEFEFTGSSNYTIHDVYSFAGLTLDYGKPDGSWSERSFLGLGLIQASRGSHPPAWGVGATGKFLMRGNVASASAQPQRVRIDPARYAPLDWDGRLWIGTLLHNVGTDRNLRVRLVDPAAPAPPPLPEEHMRDAMRASQLTQLQAALRKVENTVRAAAAQQGPPELRAFIEKVRSNEDLTGALRRAVADAATTALKATNFSAMIRRADAFTTSQIVSQVSSADGLLDMWRKGGSFGKQIGCIVRHATNLDKIGLRDLAGGTLISSSGQPVRLSAARHEYEGFQVVLTPLEGPPRSVSVHMSDLRSTGGVIPSARCKVNAVGYVRIFPGHARQQLVPDPLLEGTIPELAAGENQPVWITLYVPPDAAPGQYTGEIAIRELQTAAEVRVPVQLNVRSFDIPKKLSLRSSFWMFRDQINRFYHLDEVKLDDYLKWIDCALEHRLCPIDVYEGHCRQLVDIIKETTPPQVALHMESKGEGVPNPRPDFTSWDRYLDRMIAGGAATLPLGQSHHHGAWFTTPGVSRGSNEQVGRVIESLKTLRDHYRQRGIFDMHYMQLRDETSEQDSLNVYREVNRQMPELKLLLTVPSPQARPFIDIPCPQSAGFDAQWRDEAKSKGGEYWWYVCLAPDDPYANLFLYQSSPQHRALFWQTWDRKVEGLLYWGMNFWSWYKDKWPAGAKGPTQRVQPEVDAANFCSIPEFPGDGCSMYPGATPDKPLSSIRLEVMRDGAEDYEYFLLLDRLIQQMQVSGRRSAKLQSAQKARDAAHTLVADLTKYERDGAKYIKVREQVGDAIESLLKALAGAH
ncbi:MAG: glycoside hydrolase domain-containing protein [Candidatus Sumerlaeaceae bacterium]